MSDGSDLDVGNDLVSAIDIRSLVRVADGERVLQGNRGDPVAGDEGPVNAIDLSTRVDDGSGSDSVQGGRGNNDGIYRECFLQFVDLGMMTKGTGGVKGGVGCGGTVVNDGSEGVSGIGSTGRAAKRFEGRGEGVVDAGEAGRVEGVEGLEGPGHF